VRGRTWKPQRHQDLKRNLRVSTNTYIWLCVFSVMNFGRSKFCSRLTGEPLTSYVTHFCFYSFKSHTHRSQPETQPETPTVRILMEGYHVMTF
jgi:hypothetical protein